MGIINAIKLILALHTGWSSKTLIFARILALLPTIDVAFFSGTTGQKIVDAALYLVHLVPFLMNVTPAEVVSLLVVVIGGFVAWLRSKTTVPLAQKMQ